jgi:hypothetical protein
MTGTTSGEAAEQPQQQVPPAQAAAPPATGFGSRGRIRRRARFLRKARELAYRDLGGLVYNLHRFGQRNDALVLAKLSTLGHIDSELRGLEAELGQTQSVTVLREAGVTACPRCAAIHSSEDAFCPNCGLSLGRHAELPIAGPAAATPTPPPGGYTTITPPSGAPPAAPPPAPVTAPPPSAGASPVAAPAPAQSPPSPGGPDRPPPAGGSASPATPAGTDAPTQTTAEEEPTAILRPSAPDR